MNRESKSFSSSSFLSFAFFRLAYHVMGAVQHECIPQAILGMDVLCQAKSGMGKTAVFVLALLQQLEITEDSKGKVNALVICHTRELAYQIAREFKRFSAYLPGTILDSCDSFCCLSFFLFPPSTLIKIESPSRNLMNRC